MSNKETESLPSRLSARASAEFVYRMRDPDNGAGLDAVFVGRMPVHHFNREQDSSQYLLRLQQEIEAYHLAQSAELRKEVDRKNQQLLELSMQWRDKFAEQENKLEVSNQQYAQLEADAERLRRDSVEIQQMNAELTGKLEAAEIRLQQLMNARQQETESQEG